MLLSDLLASPEALSVPLVSVPYLLFFCNSCNLDRLGPTKSVLARCAKNLVSMVELVIEMVVSKAYFEPERGEQCL